MSDVEESWTGYAALEISCDRHHIAMLNPTEFIVHSYRTISSYNTLTNTWTQLHDFENMNGGHHTISVDRENQILYVYNSSGYVYSLNFLLYQLSSN